MTIEVLAEDVVGQDNCRAHAWPADIHHTI
jgi:hypothetical protein